ncbi:MAG: LLM class flavin-dependent oxidoreductase [Actinomycetota bacterium]
MKFGAMLAGQYLPDQSPTAQMAGAIEQVRAARDAGFDSVWMVQHFRADFAFFQPLPFLARLAAESGDMTLGTGIALLPFYPPVMFAEEWATLDIITGGRLVLGVGSGYREAEFEAFGLDKKDRIGRFTEAMETVRHLWSGEEIAEAGEYFDLRGVTLNTRPLNGTIPLWIGVVGDQAVARAGRSGDEWLVGPEVPRRRSTAKLARSLVSPTSWSTRSCARRCWRRRGRKPWQGRAGSFSASTTSTASGVTTCATRTSYWTRSS